VGYEILIAGARDSLLVKALCYKPVYLILPAALDPRVYSSSNINEYQKQKNNVSGK
jgi:hypothetical protein